MIVHIIAFLNLSVCDGSGKINGTHIQKGFQILRSDKIC